MTARCLLAERQRQGGVPFVFTSAYGVEGLAERYRDAPMVSKPYTCEEVVAAITHELNGAGRR